MKAEKSKASAPAEAEVQEARTEPPDELGRLLEGGQTIPEGEHVTAAAGRSEGDATMQTNQPQSKKPEDSNTGNHNNSQGNVSNAGASTFTQNQESTEDGAGQQDDEGAGGADIGVDASVTGYGDHDLQTSDVAGTPDQEGEKTPEISGASDTGTRTGTGTDGSNGRDAGAESEPHSRSSEQDAATLENNPEQGDSTEQEEAPEKGSGLKGFLSTLFGDDGDQEDTSGVENSSGQNEGSSGQQDNGNSGQQDNEFSGGRDAEISSELGTEEPEKAQKGFFARLFGDEPDEDEEGEEDTGGGEQGADKVTGKKDKEQTGKKAGKRAKDGQAPQEKKADPRQKKRDSERSDSLEQSIIYWQGHDKIPERLEDTKNTLTEVLGLGSSFDIVFREMTFGGRKAALLCISGFAKDTIIDEILKRLTYLTPDEVSTGALSSFMTEYIPHVQVEKGELLSESINKVLSGMSAFFLEGENQVIIMDTRAYPARGPDEPSIERVVRGARDGFTETLLSNVALVRRRIRDPGLKYEMHQVGRRTRTDVCVAYIDDIVDKTQVLAVTDKIKSVDIDGIPLADKQLEEAIVGRGWNPYPLVRYSERPDTVASHLLEGRVVIFVDTSPSVIVLPTTFFDLCQHAEENRQTPFMGTYLRWVRFIGVFASMFLLPLWMLLVIHPELKPAMLEFIGPQKMAKIPLLAQFLIVELGVDLLRMAAVHTPTPLGSAMGLIAAILVGDIAVQTGLFVNEVVLYMAVASIGMFATPSYELGLANRIVRLALLLAVAAFQVQGFMIGTTLLVILLTTHRSYNSSYLWPFIPFNAKALGAILVRQPVLSSKARPSFNKTRDNTRMPPVQENEK